MSESNKYIRSSIKNSVALITLNRPDSLNALSAGLVQELIAAINSADTDDNVGAIVLTGAGRAFSAGVDLKELSEGADTLKNDQALVETFANRTTVMIGAINGFAMTGGLELALACDFLYAAESAQFADTHAKVGIMPTWGMSQKLPRLIGIGRAREMSFSGRKITAHTACDWGLVNKVVPDDQLLDECLSLAQEIAQNQGAALTGIRRLIEFSANSGLHESLEHEYTTSHEHNDAMDMSVMFDRLNKVRGKR